MLLEDNWERHRICWEEHIKEHRGPLIPFDGTPFVILSSVVLECQFGRDRKTAAKKKAAARRASEVSFDCGVSGVAPVLSHFPWATWLVRCRLRACMASQRFILGNTSLRLFRGLEPGSSRWSLKKLEFYCRPNAQVLEPRICNFLRIFIYFYLT